MPVGVIHIAALGIGQLELHAGQRLAGQLVQLPDHQSPLLLVVESEGLHLTLFDLNTLGRAVQDIALHRLDLTGGNGLTWLQPMDLDLTGFICDELPVALPNRFARPRGDQEGHTLQRRCRALNVFLNHERRIRGVVEGQRLGVFRVHGHSLCLCPWVNGIPGNSPGLLDHDSSGDPADADLAIGVGGVQALTGQMPVGVIHIAALGIGQLELHAGQRLAGQLVQLPDHQGPLLLVVEPEGLHLTLFDLDRLGRAVQDVTLQSFDFTRGDGGARLQVRDDNAAVLIGDIFAVAAAHHRAGAVGDQEGHPLQGRCRALDIFFNHQRRGRGVGKIEGLGVVGIHLDRLGLRGRVDGIAGDGLRLRHDQCAHHTVNLDLAVPVGIVDPVAGDVAILIRDILSSGSGHTEGNSLQRLSCQGIPLVNDQAAGLRVGDDHRLGVSALADDHIDRGGIHNVPLGRPDLSHHIGARR